MSHEHYSSTTEAFLSERLSGQWVQPDDVLFFELAGCERYRCPREAGATSESTLASSGLVQGAVSRKKRYESSEIRNGLLLTPTMVREIVAK